MGLDMSLNKVLRKTFEKIDSIDVWSFPINEIEEIMYWRKKYDLDEWFFNNTKIIEECSDEINKEKLQKLIEWLNENYDSEENNFKEESIKLQEIVNEFDFTENVIYYKYSN